MNGGFPIVHQVLTTCEMTKVQNEWMLSFRKFLKQHRLHANDAHGSKLARYTVRCSTNHVATIVILFFFKNKKKKEKNKIRQIHQGRLSLQILPCFSLKVRCKLGPLPYRFTSQLLQETHSHHNLVGQEFTPISKEKKKKPTPEINHITRSMATLLKEQQFKYS